MYKNKKIGVVVPAYNEEKFIAAVIRGVPEYVDRVYVIDDASQDATEEFASKLAVDSRERVRIIRHEKNGGVGLAIVTGYKCCLIDNIEIAVVMAGDNQMDPRHLPRLLDPLVEGKADYTIGDRLSYLKNQNGMSLWRRIGNYLLKWLTRVAAWNLNIHDPQNGYTAVTMQTLSRIKLENIYSGYGYCNDLLIKFSAIGVKIMHIRMPAVYGREKSKIKYFKYITTVLWILIKGFFWRIYMAFRSKKTCLL